MGLFKSSNEKATSAYFVLLQDVGALKSGWGVSVSLLDDHLALLAKQPIKLSYNKIQEIHYGTETELIEKNKSVLGRAGLGGLVFGPAGAIVGAISGSGKKQKKVNKTLLIINYISSSGDKKSLQFEDKYPNANRKFVNQLKEICGITDEAVTEL